MGQMGREDDSGEKRSGDEDMGQEEMLTWHQPSHPIEPAAEASHEAAALHFIERLVEWSQQ